MNVSLTHLPKRTKRPRKDGVTMVMDKGLSLRQAEDIVGKNEHLQKIKEEGDTFNFLKSLKEIYDKKEFFIP